jgi:BMFP domain-containing protein YqiC
MYDTKSKFIYTKQLYIVIVMTTKLTTSELSKAYSDNVKSWFKNSGIHTKYPNASLDDLQWVVDGHDIINEYINKPITKIKDGKIVSSPRKDQTIRANLNTLCQIFKKLKLDNMYDIYIKKVDTFVKKIQKDNENNPLTGDHLDNFVEWSNILLKRDQLKKRYLKDKTNNYNNLSYVAYCLMTYQPPIRSEYCDMKIIHKSKDNNKSDNFYLITEKRNTVIINTDKVSSHIGSVKNIINSDDLKSIIKDSLEQYPRKYILSVVSNGELPMKYSSYYELLLEPFKNENKKVSVDIFRKSFLTKFYSKVQQPKLEKQIAKKMRHSADTARSYYRKYLTADMKKAIKLELKELDVPQKKEPFDKQKYMETYTQQHKTKLKQNRDIRYSNQKEKILVARILRNTRQYGSIPKQETIKKYNLVYDKETKIWSQKEDPLVKPPDNIKKTIQQ